MLVILNFKAKPDKKSLLHKKTCVPLLGKSIYICGNAMLSLPSTILILIPVKNANLINCDIKLDTYINKDKIKKKTINFIHNLDHI